MRALCWSGTNQLAVERVPDPGIVNAQDAIIRVRLSMTCGSDLPLISGLVPHLQVGDVLGHEFLGEVVEVGPEVRRHLVGDRVVVCSVIACGRCWYCRQGIFSCCDNGTPDPVAAESAWGWPTAGCYGYSHLLGGFGGSHAEYVRVPYADHGAFAIPAGVADDRALFASDAAPTGWMGTDGVQPGDVVAIWGCGAVGQLAARAAVLRGAERVICVDRVTDRLLMVEQQVGAETINYEHTDVGGELRERTGGRGPDVCVDAVGVQAHVPDVPARYGRPGPGTDRADTVHQAVHACRKGGNVFVLGMFTGFLDRFPMGAMLHKGLTVRAARQHGQRYIPMLLDRMSRDELRTEHLATHRMPLDQAAHGYRMFADRADGCVRVVFEP